MFINCHSYYSLRYGTMSPEELVDTASIYECKSLVLTDINNTTGIIDFYKACNSHSIKAIAGAEIRNHNDLKYILIAQNNIGFLEINQFISQINETGEHYPSEPSSFNNVFIAYPSSNIPKRELNANEYIMVRLRQINQLVKPSAKRYITKMILWQPITFKKSEDFLIHKHLRAIDNNTLLTKVGENQLADPSETFIPVDDLIAAFNEYTDIIKNTNTILHKCSFTLDHSTTKNKKTFTGSNSDDRMLLFKLAHEGRNKRYGASHIESERRVNHELDIIHKLGFSAYFLITWDIIRYSMSRGFYHVGRGSGANSVVAYCLQITNVDPIELNLYFERFLNPRRTSPPDFDIDYSWKDRDDVLDYIFKRYGKQYTSLLGCMSTFQGRSIYRELGKVYGLPKEDIDLLVDYPNDTRNKNAITEEIEKVALRIADFPNQRSIHAGGVLISEEPICNYTALDQPPKGMPVTQWDMYVAEDIGFEKIDILSQRGIGHIDECIKIIKENKNQTIDIHRIEEFKTDPAVCEQLKKGEAIGCFYIESPAMRGLLKKLRCNNYLSLVAASSIIRPGVAKSGMMRAYIERFHQPEKIRYLHPIMQEHLNETFGVMVYQEDVLKVGHYFGGLDLAEADILRRAMSGKFRSRKEFDIIRDKFFANGIKKGYEPATIHEVWRQMESFAGYSFSKAHSASFAVESFQSLYLKTYYPVEFMVAVINNFGGFYRLPIYVNEARRSGGQIELPCVNNSLVNTRVKEKTIWLGFIHINGLESSIVNTILNERTKNGEYQNLIDFITRTRITLEALKILIRIGSLRFTKKTKAHLLWEAHALINKKKKENQGLLFTADTKEYHLPEFNKNLIRDAYDEIELLGFPVSISSFDMLKTDFRGELKSKDLLIHKGKSVRMVGDLVCIKYTRTNKREIMNFGTWLDSDGEFFDTVHFPNCLKEYPFKGYGLYLIKGVISEEFGFASITVEKMARLSVKEKNEA